MPTIAINIPQIGEGLQEARLVAFLKKPGDTIKRDEPIYQMETDKAVMDVESPVDGVLESWTAKEDDILAIGAEVAYVKVESAEASGMSAPAHHHGSGQAEAEVKSSSAGAGSIPPRTRAYAKEKGLSDADLATLASEGKKVMPEDVDRFLASKGSSSPVVSNDLFVEEKQGSKQRLLASRLVRGTQLVVPGTISASVKWAPIEKVRDGYRASGGEFKPSAFTIFAHAVAVAAKNFPSFRSTLVGEDKVRTYHHLNLGVAVALPGDELVLAVVNKADALTWIEFANDLRAKIDLARSGKDQANESVTLSLTNMQNFGLRDAVPVVVPPAVATVFLGEIYYGVNQESGTGVERFANVSMTFDHRLINGVGAAQFLSEIKQKLESVEEWVK